MNKEDRQGKDSTAQGAIPKPATEDRDALYTYQAESEAGAQRTLPRMQRPLPDPPSAPPALSGQSRTPADSGNANEATNELEDFLETRG